MVQGVLQLPDRLDPLVLSRWTRSSVLGPRFHFKSFSISIRSASGKYLRSPAVFGLCERSPALSADDSKCSSVIKSLQDCGSLQKDLDSLHSWSDNWHLKLTPRNVRN